MLGVYLASLLFGSIVIVASLTLGGRDAEHPGGHDAGHDGEHDADGHANAHGHMGSAAEQVWVLFLSIRFWTFFAASFGLTGLILELWGAIPSFIVAPIALADGLAMGLVVSALFKRLKTDSVSGEIGLAHLVGQEARVLVPIRPGDIGKIVVSTQGGRVELLARSRDHRVIDSGATVLVAHVDIGIADVTVLHPDPGTHSPLQQETP